uniref:FAD/NAD(P)-binding domain-containing protein n=1 Tax=Ditylum brightwellii TaxID=49249 RepID=A0A7S2EUM4_9STRA
MQWLVCLGLSFIKSILSLIFHVLQVFHDSITTFFTNQRQRHPKTPKNKKKVVVIGGSFAGLSAIHKLNHYSDELEVTLVDCRDWFEYIPGILRAFVDASYASNIVRKRSTTTTTESFVQGIAKQIERNNIIVSPTIGYNGNIHGSRRRTKAKENGSDGNEPETITLPYDYLVVATGSKHKHPTITPSIGSTTAENYKDRLRAFENEEQRIRSAKSIIILGGGPVGVELAAEISCHFPSKAVTIIQRSDRLLPSFPNETGIYVEQWFRQRNVCVLLNTTLSSHNERQCITTSGDVYTADVVYVCFGMKPNSDFMVANMNKTTAATNDDTSNNSDNDITQKNSIVDPNGFILVKDTFEIKENCTEEKNIDGTVTSANSIFVVGDVASHSSNEMKQAYYAEAHGHVVAKNILAMARASSSTTNKNNFFLESYPEIFTHDKSNEMPLVYTVSLGRYDGSLGFNGFVLNGPIASLLKWIIEYTKVMQMEGKAVGEYIWWIGDTVTLWMSRNILPPPSSTYQTKN